MCADNGLDLGQQITAITEKYHMRLDYIMKVVFY